MSDAINIFKNFGKVFSQKSPIGRFCCLVKQLDFMVLSILLTVVFGFINKHQKKGRIFAPPIDVDR